MTYVHPTQLDDEMLEVLAKSLVEKSGLGLVWDNLYQAGTDERFLFEFHHEEGTKWLLEDNANRYHAYKGMTGDQYWGYAPRDGEEENEDEEYEGGMDEPAAWVLELDQGDDAGEFSKLAHIAHLGALTVFLEDLRNGKVS